MILFLGIAIGLLTNFIEAFVIQHVWLWFVAGKFMNLMPMPLMTVFGIVMIFDCLNMNLINYDIRKEIEAAKDKQETVFKLLVRQTLYLQHHLMTLFVTYLIQLVIR